MMRVCHLDTCPVGVATQNPELRKRFTGKPEFVVNFFEFIAEEVRELLAALGFRSIAEAVGHAEVLDTRAAIDHWKAHGLDLSPILHVPEIAVRRPGPATAPGRRTTGSTGRSTSSSSQLAEPALERRRAGRASSCRSATSTAPSARCSATRSPSATAATGLPDDTIDIHFTRLGRPELRRVRAAAASRCGSRATPTTTSARACRAAGSSCAPTATRRSSPRTTSSPATSSLYGATGGEVFFRGVVGERFCVRNSGATAVVEGVGDHGCEYMTGGRVVVLGPTGRNFGAGMSGGIAYVYDPRRHVRRRSSTTRWSSSSRSTTTTASGCARRSSATATQTGSAVADAAPRPTGTASVEHVPQGDAAGLQAGARRVMREAEERRHLRRRDAATVMAAAHG